MNKKLGYQILELCGILLGNAILAFGIAAFVLPHGMITGGPVLDLLRAEHLGWISRWQ